MWNNRRIEDGKQLLRGWGGDEPDFVLLNSKLTFQMTMLPEKTQYLTQVTRDPSFSTPIAVTRTPDRLLHPARTRATTASSACRRAQASRPTAG